LFGKIIAKTYDLSRIETHTQENVGSTGGTHVPGALTNHGFEPANSQMNTEQILGQNYEK